MQPAQQNFSCQNTVKIPPYSKLGNSKTDKGNPYQNPNAVMDQTSQITPQAMENTGKGGIHIEKGADKRHGAYINSCGGTVK